MFDQSQERFDVAVRGLWRLARAGNWPLLDEVGFAPSERETLADRARPERESQVFAAIRACPSLLPAALNLLRAYMAVTQEDRRAHLELLELLRRHIQLTHDLGEKAHD